MEVSTTSGSSTASLPRLRVFRNNQASPSSRSQPSGDQGQTSPPLSRFKGSPSYPDSQTSEDEFEIDSFGTRLISASLPPLDSSAPTNDTTNRLKALLDRFDSSSRTSMAINENNLPPSPSEPDSDVDLRPVQAGRASIRSLFQDALREPGDTPQRSRIKRRASFNVSGSPKVDKSRRKSTSDDDPEIIKHQDEPSSTAAPQLDRLRHQFTELMHPLDTESTFSRQSETTDSTPKRPFHSRRSKTPVYNSPIAHIKSHKDLEPFETLKDDDSETSLKHSAPDILQKRSSSPRGDPDINLTRKRILHTDSTSGRVNSDSWSTLSQSRLGPRRVGPSGRPSRVEKFDEDGLSLDWRTPRSDSMTHDTEYKERRDEVEKEQKQKLEHIWNHPSSHHSHLHSQDKASYSKVPTNGYTRIQTHLDDRHPIYEHDTPARAVSPSLSISSSRGGSREEQYERERNWNSPRLKWTHHFSHSGHSDHGSSHLSSNSKLLRGKDVDHGQADLHIQPFPDSAPHNMLHPQQSSDSVIRHSRPTSPVPKTFTSPLAQKPALPSKTEPLSSDVSPKGSSITPRESILSLAHDTSTPGSRTPSSRLLGRPGLLPPSSVKISKNEDNVNLAVDPVKRHRRTTTELSESMGAYPKQTGVAPVLAPNDSDSSLFGNESIPPPRMSTPPFRDSDISDLTISPVPSDIPLPPSPPPAPSPRHDNSVSRVDADFARLHKAIAPSFTFPPRQSSPVMPCSQSPDREVLRNSEIMQLSYSKELSGYPASPPSGDKEEWQTPKKLGNTELPTKTPHPPGAFGIPAYSADQDKHDELWRLQIGPKSQPENTEFSFPGTIALSQTPAPPGAYVTTPAPSKLRGILKVRFDRDYKDIHDSQASSIPDLQGANGISIPPSPSSGENPIDLSPSRRNKLRIVDEYGRTRRFTENGEEIVLDRKLSSHNASGVDETTLTPRRRAKMRQVDAFGNEIITNQLRTKEEINVNEQTEKESKPQRKKQTILHIAKSLGELQQDMVHEENALSATLPSSGIPDRGRLVSLATVSKTARTEREKLGQQLRDAEGVLANKLFVARVARSSQPASQAGGRSWWVRKWRLAMIIILLEVTLLVMGYRLAMVHAKHIWLKTYFDPFFPALYLNKSRPTFLTSFRPLPIEWSVFAISGNVSSYNVSSFIMGMGRSIWEGIVNWRLDPWEGWGNSAATPMVPQICPS